MDYRGLRIIMIVIGVLYVVSPIDLLPELGLGPLGYLDDLLFAIYLYWKIQKNLANEQKDYRMMKEKLINHGFPGKILEQLKNKK